MRNERGSAMVVVMVILVALLGAGAVAMHVQVSDTQSTGLIKAGRDSLYCAEAGLDEPDLRWECTVRMARRILKIKPATLDNVCRTLDIELQHHQALSDAEACAEIVLRAQAEDVDKPG